MLLDLLVAMGTAVCVIIGAVMLFWIGALYAFIAIKFSGWKCMVLITTYWFIILTLVFFIDKIFGAKV